MDVGDKANRNSKSVVLMSHDNQKGVDDVSGLNLLVDSLKTNSLINGYIYCTNGVYYKSSLFFSYLFSYNVYL